MKKIFIVSILLLSSFTIQAQDIKWETDIQKAIVLSKKTKKPMLLFFTGSDWCGWCIRLQKEVLKTTEFANWATKNVVLVELDFPRSVPQSDALRSQNMGLQETFGVQGFPTVWFSNANIKNGKPSFTGIGSTGYVKGGAKSWIAVANDILKK